jgi:hypothetical protein
MFHVKHKKVAHLFLNKIYKKEKIKLYLSLNADIQYNNIDLI